LSQGKELSVVLSVNTRGESAEQRLSGSDAGLVAVDSGDLRVGRVF
jgi:hypothetical protein